MRDLIQINSFVSELCQRLRHEYNSCDVTSRNDENLTTMSQFPKPEVVGLLMQKSRQWQAKRITPFDVQFLSEGRLSNGLWECQPIDLLIVIVVFVCLPLRVEVKSICAKCFLIVLFLLWSG